TDTNIFTDTVYNTYEGTEDAKATILNLKFSDTNGHWAKEAITKAGAFNMVKGYGKTYKPNNAVSNQEALAFVLRVIGLEEEAQAEGEAVKAQAPNNSVLSIWSTGYLSLAKNIGLITNAQYTEAINQNQDTLPAGAFKRDANATREQVATWIVSAINYVGQDALISNEQQSIYNYSDWKNISSEHINGVEVCLDNGIMKGLNNGKFNPKGSLTRAEMAQILANLDEIYNKTFGYTKKTGTVGGIKYNQTNLTGKANLERTIYIRTSDGTVDVLKYYMESSSSPQALNKDSVVYNEGSVTGLSGLREGSEIEYIVDDIEGIVKYVAVKNKNIETKDVFGKLTQIDYLTGMVQITDSKGKTFNYYATDGLIGSDATGDFAFIDNRRIAKKDVPLGESVTLQTKNNVVTKITYVGTANLGTEIRGVVIENNPQFSYITILDNNGKEVTKNYFADDIVVEKQPYYDTGDDIGYLDQMFPNFNYDPRDTTIDQIEAGDIVFIRPKEDNPNQIEKISASPNYIMRYGKVTQITKNATKAELTVQFENGQIASYTVPNGVFISKSGKPVNISELVSGDWVKLLVNEAILAPGETMESVKEIIIEGSGHTIGDLVKGEIGTINTIQKEISITNSYVLGKSGWEDFKQIRKLSLSNNDIEYYYDGKRVDLAFVEKYLKRSNGQAYIALEQNYAGNVISKITFRTGRDEVLEPDVIVSSNNMGTFALASGGTLQTDIGTIIRKDGKLVDASSIQVNNYARVSLNGDGKAAIVDIYDAPATDGISIARGRVSAIDEGRSFTVESMSQLIGNTWTYSPVSRKFTIDGNTLFITEDGIQIIDKFIGITSDSQIGKAFTIVYEGSKATHIIDMPYPTKVVSGTIYSKDENIVLKDGKFINSKGAWETVGVKDSSINLETNVNTIVIKGNKVVSPNSLQKGDLVRVLTETLPDKVTGGVEIEARIIFVGN
ncbi:MAG: S-layer homology domain-containing protein, partial [Eubacteriales bacterium]|nr:S-layer homology domain-containing protein [Eubacteriales bacterium]